MRRFRLVKKKDTKFANGFIRWFAQEQRWGWRGYSWYRVPYEGTSYREDAPKALLTYLEAENTPIYEYDPIDGHLLQVKSYDKISLLKAE